MKFAKLLLLLCLSLNAVNMVSAQTQKLPKIRYTTGFWSDKFELGEKDAKQAEIMAHLQKTNADAYAQFRRGKSLENQGWLWGAIAVAGAAVGYFSEQGSNASLGGFGAGIVGIVGVIATSSSASNKYKKAVGIYNQANGY